MEVSRLICVHNGVLQEKTKFGCWNGKGGVRDIELLDLAVGIYLTASESLTECSYL